VSIRAGGKREVVSTGVTGFDLILGGGLPARACILVTGDPGCGKTVLCSQVSFAHARAGGRVVLATVTSESHEKVVSGLRGFSFFEPERLGEEVFLVSAYPAMKRGPDESREMLLSTVNERSASLLFIDGLRAIRDLWRDEAVLRQFLYELNVGLAARDCIGLIATEYSLADLLQLPEATTLDGIVHMSTFQQASRRLRRIEVLKLRGQCHLLGQHVLSIDSDGVSIYPRLEAALPQGNEYRLSKVRAGFGLPELDRLLCGGVLVGSNTLIVGSAGIGKTLLAAHFVADGARRGERALFVSFNDSRAALIDRAARVGLLLEPLVANGRLHVSSSHAIEAEADALAYHLLREVNVLGARRVAIDGLNSLETALPDPARLYNFLSALVLELRRAGATTLFTKQIAKIHGPSVDFSDTPLAVTSENLLSLRTVEIDGRLHRVLSIPKMTDSDHDSSVREFRISSEGVRVLDPFDTAPRVLAIRDGDDRLPVH
jgi:circadian clock protein KaiC